MKTLKRTAYSILLAAALFPLSAAAQEEDYEDSIEQSIESIEDTIGDKKKLAIINAYNEVAAWPRNFINTIIQEISNHPDFEPVRVTHLCNSLIHNEEDFEQLKINAFNSFGDYVPDYLVLIGNFAFTLRDEIKEHWGDVPILLISQTAKYADPEFYFTTDNKDYNPSTLSRYPLEELRDDYNFSIIYTPTRYRETIDMMVQMQPEMKKLVFLADGLYLSRHYSHQIEEYLALKYPNVEYFWQLAESEGDMVPYLSDTDPTLGLLLSTWYYQDIGVLGYPMISATDSYLIRTSHRPVFGLRYSYLNYGIIGGYFDDAEKVEQLVVEGLNDLIAGKNMSEVPFRGPVAAHPYVNYNRIMALGISPDTCPPNTEFLNKQLSDWDRYKIWVWSGVGLLIVAILAFIAYLIAKRRPKFRPTEEGLINSMPIGYMQILLELDKEGKAKKVVYGPENQSLKHFIEGYKWRDVYSNENPQYWQNVVEAIKSDSSPKPTIIKSKDGENSTEIIVKKDPHSSKNRILLDVFAIDVTDKVKVESALRDAAKNAIEADNMKSAFLANMSHEIRTPLNAIVGFANLVCKTTDPEKKKRFVEIIEVNNNLLLKLIGDILDISKADSDKLVINRHKIDVNKLITTICAGIDMSLRPHVRLEKKLPLQTCYIISDTYRVTQVINNLITNAVKFTERGSISVGYEVEGDKIRFFVRDTGMGISETDLAKLFTRFTKLNSFVQGTGLGLSISKAIIEKLGGTIKGESAGKNKGATFSFTLPFSPADNNPDTIDDAGSDDEARLEELKKRAGAERRQKQIEAAANEEKNTLPSYKREKKKILVVEDNQSNTELINALIGDRYELVYAADGREAVKVYVKETPDLVLMDLNLPVKDGYEATAEIRTLSQNVPIIAVTAYAQRADRIKVFSSGFDDYLSKPVDEVLLLETIRKFLG